MCASHWVTCESSPQRGILFPSHLQPASSLLSSYSADVYLVATMCWVGFWGTVMPHCKAKDLCPHGAYVLVEVLCVCTHLHMHTRALVHAWVEHAHVDECGFLGTEEYLENPLLFFCTYLCSQILEMGAPGGFQKLNSPGFHSSSAITCFVHLGVI